MSRIHIPGRSRSRFGRRYGCIPDRHDERDHYRVGRPATLLDLPKCISLIGGMPPVYDQGRIGSCTANGLAACHQFAQGKQAGGGTWFVPSRLFIYYNERVMEGTVNEDAGAQIADGAKSLAVQGVCPEREWPYSDDDQTFKISPGPQSYKDALNHQTVKYERVVQTLGQIKAAIAEGFPVVFGTTLYPSFESTKVVQTGVVPMPGWRDRLSGSIGGHCMVAYGYDDSVARFTVRNSWGALWARGGSCLMPYAYISDPRLTSDLWIITLVEEMAG